MSTTFSAMDIGRTGVGFSHHWLDTIAHNLANINSDTATDAEPFRAVRALARPNQRGPFAESGSGVHLAAQVLDDRDAPVRFDPNHPLADEDGNVAGPVMDTVGMMSDLIIAQRSYQSNLRTVQSAREAYEAALQLGRGR